MEIRSRPPEELLKREMLRARARSLARKEIELLKHPEFRPGTLISNPAHIIRKEQIEQMRKSITKDYHHYVRMYAAT